MQPIFYESVLHFNTLHLTVCTLKWQLRLPSLLGPFEAWLSKHVAVGPFLAGKLTWVDFFFAEHIDQLAQTFPDCLATFPQLQAYCQRYFALPELVKFKHSPCYFKSPINNVSAYIQG